MLGAGCGACVCLFVAADHTVVDPMSLALLDAESGDESSVQCVLFAINSKSVLRLEMRYESVSSNSKISTVDPLPTFDPASTMHGMC